MTDESNADRSEELLALLFTPEPGSRVAPETLARRRLLYDIVLEMEPMTVRQVFYQATVRGVVPKTEKGYQLVVADLCRLRESGILPYECLVDNTRWAIRPQTFTGVADALNSAAKHYRKSLWHDADCQVQIWIEKDALTGVVSGVTSKYDVPLRAARGYSSKSFTYDAAMDLGQYDVPIYVYHFGDYDPSGVNAAEKIDETLRELAPDADIHFERIAVTEDQIDLWNLPTRPTKQTDSRARRFGSDVSVELDAIEPELLRRLVERVIRRHITDRRYHELMKQEAAEKRQITGFVAGRKAR